MLVPGGRSVPACLDKNTGEFEYYRLSSNGKNGGDFVAANDKVFFNHYVEKSCNMFDTGTRDKLVNKIGRYPVIDGDTIYTSYEGDFLLFSGNVGLSYVSTTAGMWHYRSKKLFTPIICVICVNLWQIKLLATD